MQVHAHAGSHDNIVALRALAVKGGAQGGSESADDGSRGGVYLVMEFCPRRAAEGVVLPLAPLLLLLLPLLLLLLLPGAKDRSGGFIAAEGGRASPHGMSR